MYLEPELLSYFTDKAQAKGVELIALINELLKKDIDLRFIQPGNPQQNAYIERFNRTARHEWLNQNLFDSIEHAQETATRWMWSYNSERPNTAIGAIPPYEKLQQAA